LNFSLFFDFWGAFWWVLTTFWWLFPVIALFMWIIVMSLVRTVMNRVLYIRKGGTMSFHRCVVHGTNIKFRPERSKRARPITVHIEAQPYTFVKGLNTYRVYVVTEGGGKTVSFPQSTVEEFLAENNLTKKFEEWLEENGYKNVSIPRLGTNPTYMAAAASISLFERATTHLAENLPKTKAQYILMVLYILMGVAIGLAWGMLAGKLGWV